MAMPAEVGRRWTAREVRELIAAAPLATPRYELVDADLLVTPGPSLFHQRAIVELVLRLGAYLRTERVGHVITSPSDVEPEPEFITQPDIFVIPTAEWRRVAADDSRFATSCSPHRDTGVASGRCDDSIHDGHSALLRVHL